MSPIHAHELRGLIGLPWREHGGDARGVDCWQLVVFAYDRLFHVKLPRYDEADPLDCRQVAMLIESGKQVWRAVPEAEVRRRAAVLAGVARACRPTARWRWSLDRCCTSRSGNPARSTGTTTAGAGGCGARGSAAHSDMRVSHEA